MTYSKKRTFAIYDDAVAFRKTRIRQGYTTALYKTWQGIYTVSYK